VSRQSVLSAEYKKGMTSHAVLVIRAGIISFPPRVRLAELSEEGEINPFIHLASTSA
jgi:hypothetical protein